MSAPAVRLCEILAALYALAAVSRPDRWVDALWATGQLEREQGWAMGDCRTAVAAREVAESGAWLYEAPTQSHGGRWRPRETE